MNENVRAFDDRRTIALFVALSGATAFAWIGVLRAAATMPMAEPASAMSFTFQWGVMMTAMMLPSAAPMILLYRTVSRSLAKSGDRVIAPELFAAVYVALWLATGIPVYLASLWASAAPALSAAKPYVIASALFAGGIYQLTPVKRACLRECEAPLDFLMRRWRSGYVASLRLAGVHAAYCIGCCWALMLVLVVAGAMSVPWVLAIALGVFAEKILPGGERTARIIGVVLIVLAFTVAISPDVADALRPSSQHSHSS